MRARHALLFIVALLYGALASGATPAAAAELSAEQVAALKEARRGDMEKLVIHPAPRPRLERAFEDRNGASVTIADFAGKVVVFNFWATWCPPCRKEMPTLNQLRADMANEGVDVMVMAMDRASVEKIDTFFMAIKADSLEVYRDPTLRIGTEAGILGLPVTLILDREGREIARLQGEADWAGEDAKDMLRRIKDALDAKS